MDGELVIAEPYTGFRDGACHIENQIAGKVVVIARGDASFESKSICAQDAGAVGVIITNNDETNPGQVFEMYSGATLNIPVVMVSYNEGVRIRALGAGTPVAFVPGSCAERRVSATAMV